MTPSHDRTCRDVRRAEPHRRVRMRPGILGVLPLCLALWGCQGPDTVEHHPDSIDVANGEDPAPTKYVFDPDTVRTLHGYVLAVQPFQRMKNTRYGVRLRIDVQHERAYVYLAPQGFLEDLGLAFDVGDEVDVTGSLLGEPGQRVMIAAEIAKDGKAYALRNDEGQLLWKR